MNDTHDDLTRVLAALEEPEPPGALRERALARAEAAWERPAADRWLALWESRTMRLAWAGAVVALAAANVAVRTAAHAGRPSRPPSAASDLAARGSELQGVVALPRLRAAYAAIGAAPGNAATPYAPEPPQPLQRSEDKS